MTAWSALYKRVEKEVAKLLDVARTKVLRRYGASVSEFLPCITGLGEALYVAGESGGERWGITGYPECGLGQLTAHEGGDDEVGKYNVDPFSPRPQLWALMLAFWDTRKIVVKRLSDSGWGPLQSYGLSTQAAFPMLGRSVGVRCVRGLLRQTKLRVPRANSMDPMDAVELLLQDPTVDVTPYSGVQDNDTVRVRFIRCLLEGNLAEREPLAGDPLTPWVAPSRVRPTGLAKKPVSFYSRIRALSEAARAAGPAATGPWPKV